ncbi:UV excision repair protein RAD23 homolog B [Drosophila grimshawi]|uniref:GH23932 n=1 Tax=Drosophila grimshawi TaxID=7222 RepID=B4JZU9_DROGR|nr:UV excision repair protein RAD23 homolog B [Drosophila grimshawi]EDV90965.1 GH23932 [Drosophila grimshawi]
MIITVKNLQQQTFSIDFDPEKTVLDLKKTIFNERGAEYLVEKQKLIYAGVILTDERTISSYKVDEKKFIVVMLTRDISVTGSGSITNTTDAVASAQRKTQQETTAQPKAAAAESKAEAKPTSKSNAVAEGTTKTNKTTNESIVEPASTAAVAGAARATDVDVTASDYSSIDLVGELANASLQTRAESNLLMGEEYNRTVASMIEMGYARDQVERAMSASFNNPERAVEYLITGIPQEESLFNAGHDDEDVARAGSLLQQQVGGGGDGGSASDLQTDSSADPFEFLRSQPQFLQMRSLIYQNPHLLHAVLQQIGQTNPALLQLISENQDAFLNMLNQPLEGEVGGDNSQRLGGRIASSSSSTTTTTTAATTTATNPSRQTESSAQVQRSAAGAETQPITVAAEDVGGLSQERSLQQESQLATIRLTPQDQDAIERLKALGFPETLVLQAYFACEKDEELAANFLLASSFDD